MTPFALQSLDRGDALQDALGGEGGRGGYRSELHLEEEEEERRRRHAGKKDGRTEEATRCGRLGCIDPDIAGQWQVRLLVGWADKEDGLGTWKPGNPVIWAVGLGNWVQRSPRYWRYVEGSEVGM